VHTANRMHCRSVGTSTILSLALSLAFASACTNESNAPAAASSAATKPAAESAPAKPAAAAAKAAPAIAADTGDGVSGRHRAEDGETWVPSEYKSGMARFKDPYVYVDGQPRGVLKWAELPLDLEPVWEEVRAAVNWRKGDPWPDHVIERERRYRMTDYLAALGVNVRKVKEVHIYGGGRSERPAAVVPGAEMRRHKDDFQFRFGSFTYGKPIPVCPDRAWNCADHILSISVYVNKKPPKKTEDGMFLGDEPVVGVPYFGEPLRGGIRILLDGRYVARIKRRMLEGEDIMVIKDDDSVHWKFLPFLEKQGVDTSKIQEAWLVRGQRLARHVTRGELEFATFTASPQGKGAILFGRENTVTTSLQLHTKTMDPNELPVILPHEIEIAE